jgi:hypothetical protein
VGRRSAPSLFSAVDTHVRWLTESTFVGGDFAMNRPDLDVIEARAEATVLVARDDVPVLIAYIQELEASRTLDYKLVAEERIRLQKQRITELENALAQCVVAFQLTREYVGEEVLPAIPRLGVV